MIGEERHTNVWSRTRTVAASAVPHADTLLDQHAVRCYHEVRQHLIKHATRAALALTRKINPAALAAPATAEVTSPSRPRGQNTAIDISFLVELHAIPLYEIRVCIWWLWSEGTTTNDARHARISRFQLVQKSLLLKHIGPLCWIERCAWFRI